jgi:hypothetical protein
MSSTVIIACQGNLILSAEADLLMALAGRLTENTAFPVAARPTTFFSHEFKRSIDTGRSRSNNLVFIIHSINPP